MANITIKGDPKFGAAIAEGAATVELRAVKAEYARLQAVDAIRREGDDRRWERTRRRLARKYSTKPVGRARGAILGLWGLLWLSIYEWCEYFSAWNMGGAHENRMVGQDRGQGAGHLWPVRLRAAQRQPGAG